MADGILTPCNACWHDQIDFARWLHPAMWHVALESWQWIHQVAAPCNVIRGSGMTCHWIRRVAAPCNGTRSSGIMTLNSPGGSTLQCGRWLWDDMPLNSLKCPPYWNSTYGFDFDHITAVDLSFCTSLLNFIQIGPPSEEKNDVMRFSRWRISAILNFTDSIMGSLKSPITTYYCLWFSRKSRFFCILASTSMYDFLLVVNRHHSSKLFSFWENRVFLHFGDRQTDGHARRMKPLSLSQAAA